MTVITMSHNELTRLRVLIDIADGRLSVADARHIAAASARSGVVGFGSAPCRGGYLGRPAGLNARPCLFVGAR